MNRPKVARILVAVIAAFNVLLGAVYFIVGAAAVSFAAFNEESAGFGLRSVFIVLYAIFLFACGVGLWREQPWGWHLGMAAGGFSWIWAVADAARGTWAIAAFDAAYGALLVGCLLTLRRSGANAAA